MSRTFFAFLDLLNIAALDLNVKNYFAYYLKKNTEGKK